MTNSISIDNFGSGIREWASEETISDILAEMKKLNKSLTSNRSNVRGAVQGNKGDLKSLQTDLDNNTKAARTNTVEKDKNTASTKRSTTAMALFAAGASRAIGALTALGGALYSAATFATDSKLEIYRSGAAFSESIGSTQGALAGLSQTMHGANLTFGDLVKLTAEYGTTISREGSGMFTRIASTLRRDFNKLGMTSQETASFIAAYLKGQEKYALHQQISEQKQRDNIKRAAENLNNWSQVLGISKKQIQDSINAEKEKPNVAAFLSTIGDASIQAFDSVLAGLATSPETKAKLSEALADPYIARSQLYADLMSAGATEAGLLLSDLQAAVLNSPKDVPEVMERFRNAIANADVEQSLIMGDIAKGFQALRGEMSAVQQAYETQSGQLRDGVTDQAAFVDSKTELTISFQDISNTLDESITMFTQLNHILADIVNGFNDNILKPMMAFEVPNFIEDLKSIDIKGMFDDIDGKTLATYLGVGIAAVLGGSLFSKILGKILGTSLSKTGGAAGGGIVGGTIAGTMSGIAAGLVPFGSPAVIKGAAGLGAVIAGIATGIAGAQHVLGETTDKFISALIKISEVDGARLAAVGKGIAELSQGLAYLAGAEVAKAFAAVSTAFSELFDSGKRNPVDMLREFAESTDDIIEPLGRMGESLGKFAPQFEQFMKALSYENKFDADKFKETISIFTGKNTGGFFGMFQDEGIDSTKLETLKSSIQGIVTATDGMALVTERTDNLATSITGLAEACERLRSARQSFAIPDVSSTVRKEVEALPMTRENFVEQDPRLIFDRQQNKSRASETPANKDTTNGDSASRNSDEMNNTAIQISDKLTKLIELSAAQSDNLSDIRKELKKREV